MTLLQAAIAFAISLMDSTNHSLPYDKQLVSDVAAAIVSTTSDCSEVETLIRISRWESGGYRKDVINCKVKGDHGQAHGIFQVHPWTALEAKQLCGSFVEQATIALARVRESRNMCARFGLKNADGLTGYTHGTCVRNNPSANLYWGDGKTIDSMISVIEEEEY